MDLSVVIVNWNTCGLLKDCLASLFTAVSGLHMEVFVVDNGSSDDSVAMVRTHFPAVALLENGKNLGFACANNRALQQARGRYLLLLNSDTLIRSGALEGLVKTMEENPDVGVAGLQLLNADESLQNSISNDPGLLTELGNKSLLRRFFPERFPGKEQAFTEPRDVESVIGACLLVRREAAEQVGWLDEDYFFFLEETDWCLRMRRAGWRVIHDPRYRIVHLQGKTAGKINVRARIEYWRSRYIFFAKHYRPSIRACLRAGLLFRLVVNLFATGLANLFSGFSNAKLKNKLAVYAALFVWHLRGCPVEAGLPRD